MLVQVELLRLVDGLGSTGHEQVGDRVPRRKSLALALFTADSVRPAYGSSAWAAIGAELAGVRRRSA
jgi:hypothetical protein